jgi:hypothetical protein
MRGTAVLLALCLVGCATKQTQTYWEKPGASQQDFQADMGQCRAQAFSVPGAMNNLVQVAIVQNTCMQGKGWYLVEQETQPSQPKDALHACHDVAEKISKTKNSFDDSYKYAYEGCMASHSK